MKCLCFFFIQRGDMKDSFYIKVKQLQFSIDNVLFFYCRIGLCPTYI